MARSSRFHAVLAASLAIVACQDEPTGARVSPITGGATTSGDPAVVALVLGGRLSCTATLIAPRVILTAAHCLPETGPRPEVRFGADVTQPELVRAIALARVHAEFDRVALTNDIGVALLDGPAPAGVVPAALPDAAIDGATPGTAIRVVGFGETSVDAHDVGLKREGVAIITASDATTFTLHPDPSQPCHGDSGGPAFASLAGDERVIGVTSAGDASCVEYGRDTRVTGYLDELVRPFIAATAAGSARPGDRCYYAEQCAAGDCLDALDDPSLAFCAPPCAADGSCADGLECLVGSDGRDACYHPPPSPGALGAPCAVSADCATGLCAARAGEAQCTVRCFPDVLDCPAGFECEDSDDGRGASACFSPPDSGGCNAGTGTGELAPLLVLVACGLVRTRNCKGVRT